MTDKSGTDEYGVYDVTPLSMVKGGQPKPFNVYRKPRKHIILDQNIPPRGWYKAAHEPDRVRPRPCYTEAVLTTPYGGFCPVNCSFCLDGGTLIDTPIGNARIDELRKGDVIWGRVNGGIEYTEVLGTFNRAVESYYVLELDNGAKLNITGDHPVYVVDRGWVVVEDLREEERLESLQFVRGGVPLSNQRQTLLRRMPQDTEVGIGRKIQCNQAQKVQGDGCRSDLREMRGAQGPSQAQVVREMFASTLLGYGEVGQREIQSIEGHSQICGDSPQDVYSRNGQSARTGLHPVFGMAGADVYKDGQGSHGVQDQQAVSICNGRRAQGDVSLRMGVPDCRISGLQWYNLGIRGGGVFSGRHSRDICAGLPSVRCSGQFDEDSGSEGVFSGGRPCQISEIPGVFCGGQYNPGVVGCSEVEGVGYTTVIGLRRVDEPLHVYDIQTTTENFYAGGLLVHNCYVNNGTRGYRATGLPTVDPAYPDKMAKRLAKMMVSGAGYITSFTEPFHPLEDTYHVTQRLSQAFINEGLPLFYCTRKLPTDWAVDALLENPYSYIQWSVNTSNPDDCVRMSPGTADLYDILDCVEFMSGEGIYTSFQCNPIHPGITSLEELVELIDLASEAGLDHIIFKFVEQVSNNRKVIVERLRQRKFPSDKVDTFDALFNQVIGGVYTIQQDVRIWWLNVLLEETRAAGVSMGLCYEYYYNGKAGANLAPWYTTSDGCHGRGVPVYYRSEPGAPFQPFPCYRKGCLYCAEYGTCACDNEDLLAAKALQYKDLRAIRIQEPEDGWSWDWPDSCARPLDASYADAINPGWQTDAELWDWPPLEEVLEEICAGS